MPRVVVENPNQLRELLVRYQFPLSILSGVSSSLRDRVEVILPYNAPDGSPEALVLIPLSLDLFRQAEASTWASRRPAMASKKDLTP